MESSTLKCKQCNWQGRHDEVNWDAAETCMGTDQTEVCPHCGSLEVYLLPAHRIAIPWEKCSKKYGEDIIR